MSSLWIETTKEDLKTEVLNGNIETEICIIGAGIFGLTTAYYLGQCGKKVTVIEKERIGEKVSGNTTGKITYQHNLIYNYLTNSYGEKSKKQKLIIKGLTTLTKIPFSCKYETTGK